MGSLSSSTANQRAPQMITRLWSARICMYFLNFDTCNSYQVWWLRRKIKYFITIYDGKLPVCFFHHVNGIFFSEPYMSVGLSTCALERNHDKLIFGSSGFSGKYLLFSAKFTMF